jgi:hypothetical protein
MVRRKPSLARIDLWGFFNIHLASFSLSASAKHRCVLLELIRNPSSENHLKQTFGSLVPTRINPLCRMVTTSRKCKSQTPK